MKSVHLFMWNAKMKKAHRRIHIFQSYRILWGEQVALLEYLSARNQRPKHFEIYVVMFI